MKKLFEVLTGALCIVIIVLCIVGTVGVHRPAPTTKYQICKFVEPINVLQDEDYIEDIRQSAMIASIGTEYELDVWKFSVTELIRIIANEGGEDFDVCWAVATACQNAQIKEGLDPVSVCNEYRYDTDYRVQTPLSVEAARLAVIDVFVHGIRYEGVGNATMFYAPQYGYSWDHEVQTFVCEVNGVKFFEETYGQKTN